MKGLDREHYEETKRQTESNEQTKRVTCHEKPTDYVQTKS